MKSPILISLSYQLVFLVPVSLILLMTDKVIAYSFVFGGLVYMLPNLYFVHYAFRYTDAKASAWIARSFSWGESGKLVLAALGFLMVFRLVDPLNTAALMTGFCCMIVLQWFVAARIAKAMIALSESA